MILKVLQKIVTVLLLLSVFISAIFFILFPKLPDIKIFMESNRPERITRNTTLSLLTTLSPPNLTALIEELDKPGALEHISTEQLIKYKNEGKVLFNMEEQNTTLLISSANIKGKVVDGENAHHMDRGFWHFPLSGQPGSRGNTVIIAHRFLHLPPKTDTFFSLDKVSVGDRITVNQKDGTYNYTVVQTRVVDKSDRSVIENTSDHRLTLITCTPLWTSDMRLVVVAKLDKIYQSI